MNEIELKMMRCMVSILNEATLTKEQYDSRLEDLKRFEQDTGFVLFNSPTQDIDLKSIMLTNEVLNPNFEELTNVNDIAKCFDKKEVDAYISLDGVNVLIIYNDGIIVQIETSDIECLKQVDNIPYKINRDGFYGVYGKVALVDGKLRFFVDDIVDDIDNSINKGFERAKELGFDVVPNWFGTNLNPKALQNTIDYIFDYAEDDGLSCNGIVFRDDNVEYNEDIRYVKFVRGGN